MSSIPLLSPSSLISNPANVNPLAHATYNTAATVAGAVAQEKTKQDKSDSVTISRQALDKAAEAGGKEKNGKGAQTKGAPERAKGK